MIADSKRTWWFERALALRGLVDLAGASGRGDEDVSFRNKIKEAFHSGDCFLYEKEVSNFIRYCFEDVVCSRFLKLDEEQASKLSGASSFYSRAILVLGPQRQCDNFITSFFDLENKVDIEGVGCQYSAFMSSGNMDSKFYVRRNFYKYIYNSNKGLMGFLRRVPCKISFSIIVNSMELSKKLACLLMKSSGCLEANGCDKNVCLSDVVRMPLPALENLLFYVLSMPQKTEKQVIEDGVFYLMKFLEQMLPFGVGHLGACSPMSECPKDLRAALSRNRDWLENEGKVRLSEFLAMAAFVLFFSWNSGFHLFHFGLGHEEEFPKDSDSASGDMIVFDATDSGISVEEFYGIHFLMQECMSSLSILESEIIQSHLVNERKIAEHSRFILRKLHHALAGPVSVAFNRYALRYRKLLENAPDNGDREALSEIYSILKSARAQVVSWAAFCSPQGIQIRPIDGEVDLRCLVGDAVEFLLPEGPEGVEVVLSPPGKWTVSGRIDVGLVDLVIWQLVRNTVEHYAQVVEMAEGRLWLWVEFSQGSDCWTLRFKNLALGVSPEDVDILQATFRSGRANVSCKANGQGLGLLTCYEIAQLHEGDFYISLEDGYFVATLTLPTKAGGAK